MTQALTTAIGAGGTVPITSELYHWICESLTGYWLWLWADVDPLDSWPTTALRRQTAAGTHRKYQTIHRNIIINKWGYVVFGCKMRYNSWI